MGSFDVIVPCYRYAHFLRECVESILTQSLRNIRILIIDDASPDNTVEVATQLMQVDARITFLRHTRNRGHIATYNEGIDWASGDYLLILSADDYLLPGALERASDLMNAHPELGFIYGRGVELADGTPAPASRRCDDSVSLSKPAWRVLRGDDFIELSGPNNVVCTPTAVVRTALQKQVGGYRAELPHAGDMEMWLRLAAHASVGIVDDYQAVYRRHSSNMSLAYATHGWLPDVQQRKAALDYFFRNCASRLSNPQVSCLRALRSLARTSIGFASAAFNEGDMEASKQLSDFALGICPEVRQSLPWIKLACKRTVGFAAWKVLGGTAVGARRPGL